MPPSEKRKRTSPGTPHAKGQSPTGILSPAKKRSKATASPANGGNNKKKKNTPSKVSSGKKKGGAGASSREGKGGGAKKQRRPKKPVLAFDSLGAAAKAALAELMDHPYNGGIFNQPVTEAEAPEYFSVVAEPMDLGTVLHRVQADDTASAAYYGGAFRTLLVGGAHSQPSLPTRRAGCPGRVAASSVFRLPTARPTGLRHGAW